MKSKNTFEGALCFTTAQGAFAKRDKYSRDKPPYWRWNAVALGDNDFGRASWNYAARLQREIEDQARYLK